MNLVKKMVLGQTVDSVNNNNGADDNSDICKNSGP